MQANALKKKRLRVDYLLMAVCFFIFGVAVYIQHTFDKGVTMTILCYAITCVALITITFIPDMINRKGGIDVQHDQAIYA